VQDVRLRDALRLEEFYTGDKKLFVTGLTPEQEAALEDEEPL
jgi:hypothetical protein